MSLSFLYHLSFRINMYNRGRRHIFTCIHYFTISCILRWWPVLWSFLVALPRRKIFTRFTTFWIYPPFLEYPAENVSFIISVRRTFHVWYLMYSILPCVRSKIYFVITHVLKSCGSGLLSIPSYFWIHINKRILVFSPS